MGSITYRKKLYADNITKNEREKQVYIYNNNMYYSMTNKSRL